MDRDEALERVAASVIHCAFQLHRDLGPGLLESAYEALMVELLREHRMDVARQISLPLRYRRIEIANAFRVDLLVEGRLVAELKSVEKLAPLHGKQVLTYLRLINLPLGLLINFGEAILKSGIRRIANDYPGDRR